MPVPKHSSPTCLNDYRPISLTLNVMKCLEWLVLEHLKKCFPPILDPHQFAYRSTRSTEDAVCTVLHSVLTHLNNNNTYVRMLFVDFSSAFNIVIPSKLTTKLGDLGVNTSLCNWIMDFLTNRPQHVRNTTPAPPPSHSTPAYHRAVCWAHSSTPSTPMTAGLCMDPTPSSILQMTPRWLASSETTMRLPTGRTWPGPPTPPA